jgi:hypothetical protein
MMHAAWHADRVHAPTTMHDRGGHGTPPHHVGQRTFFKPSLVHNGVRRASRPGTAFAEAHAHMCITHSPQWQGFGGAIE